MSRRAAEPYFAPKLTHHDVSLASFSANLFKYEISFAHYLEIDVLKVLKVLCC